MIADVITFDDFIEYGKQNNGNIVNGMPWAFNYNGHPITHENDECYLIPTSNGVMRFTPNDVLVTKSNGDIYPCSKKAAPTKRNTNDSKYVECSNETRFKRITSTIREEGGCIGKSISRIKQLTKGYIPDNVILDIIRKYDGYKHELVVHLVDSSVYDCIQDKSAFTTTFTKEKDNNFIITDDYRVGGIRFASRYGDHHQTIITSTEIHVIFDIPQLVIDRNPTLPLSIGLNVHKIDIPGKRVICNGINLQRQ